jgi:PAS domain S-box-containing protein
MLDLLPVARDAVIEMLDDGVVVVDPKGRVVDVNDAATGILGEPAATLVGTDVADAFSAFPQLLVCYENRTGTDDLVIGRGDSQRHYDVQVSSFAGDAGSGRAGTVLVLHDITALRNRESELQRQNEQLEVVTDTLSHDLRNPLNVAAGFLQQARAGGDDDAFDRVENAHERMLEIIEDVLALARHDDDVEMSPVDLERGAADAWANVDTADATLEIEGSATLRADRGQMLTLFENLFRNAVEHADEAATVRVGLTEDGFFVADDGPGIPAEEREEIFDHGYTTNDRGTGFGLSIVSRVVDAHGWSVVVTDSESGGARFEISGVERTTDDAQAPMADD